MAESDEHEWLHRMNNINLHTNSFIKIAIGDQEAQFHIMRTDAPKEYDGFGTFCVGDFKGERTVLIRVEHLAWQQGRYQLGMFYMRPSDLGNEAITEFLWSRVEARTPWQAVS